MDLVGYSRGGASTQIEAEYRAFARADRPRATSPASRCRRCTGDNVVAAERQHAVVRTARRCSSTSRRSRSTTSACERAPFRMPVQWVNRPNLDFRGFAGTIVGGIGAARRPRPRRCRRARRARVARIVTLRRRPRRGRRRPGGHAHARRRDRRQPRRRDVAADDAPPSVADQFEATVVWMGEDADAAAGAAT